MDCTSKSGFESYVLVLHCFAIVSVPLYTLAILGLLKVNSTYFVTYKHFLIWHTVINFLSEMYNSWFFVPVVHLPHPLLRMTGIMTSLGFSGLFQFYIICVFVYLTAYLILEMFMFRFRASLYTYKTSWFYIYLKTNIYAFRLLMVIFFIISIATYSNALEIQDNYRRDILKNFPDSPLEILCFSVAVAKPSSDFVSLSCMLIWVIVITLTVTATSTTTIYLNKCLREGELQSAAVVKMQKMLLVSLFVQTTIHIVMLAVPNAILVYAVFFGAQNPIGANYTFLFLTSHSFFSTLSMIIFTPPIRVSIGRFFKCSEPVHAELMRRSSTKP